MFEKKETDKKPDEKKAVSMSDAPDIDVLAARTELEDRIRKVLVKLPALVRHRLRSDSLWRISECMGVTENTYDFGRLPVYYKTPRSPRAKKYDCLRALATWVVVKWWDYSLGKNKTPFPQTYLEELEIIAEKGLDSFKVAGDYQKGFHLEER